MFTVSNIKITLFSTTTMVSLEYTFTGNYYQRLHIVLSCHSYATKWTNQSS